MILKTILWWLVCLAAAGTAVSAQPVRVAALPDPASIATNPVPAPAAVPAPAGVTAPAGIPYAVPVPAAVPAAIITLPPGEHAVLVEKKTQRFYVYGSDSGSRSLVRVFETACSTGEAPGPKQVEGDKKTPEGIYFIVNEHLEKDLTPIYGPRAFPLDYPHLLDRRQGKTGYAIWIHGTDKALKPMDTNGCVALENADVLRLSDFVTRHVTPVIIQETIPYADPALTAEWEIGVTRFLAAWVRAHLAGTEQDHAARYLSGSLLDRAGWEAWDRHRRLAEQAGNPFRIQISRKGIYRHKDMVVAAMDFDLVQEEKTLPLGRRRLFLQAAGPGMFYIAGDEFQGRDPSLSAMAVLAAGAERMLEEKLEQR